MTRLAMESSGVEPEEASESLTYFFADRIRPEIMRRWRPTVFEIGIDQGVHSRALLKACVWRLGRVIGIDPSPAIRIQSIFRVLPHGELIQATSLAALPMLIERNCEADIAIVDGDHNYFTVSRELALVEKCLSPSGVVFLHDVGWPYGRRDLYYEPDLIPESERHPYAAKGMRRGQSDLVDAGGLNGHLYNALHEGGPKNGVLTAIEDFVAASPQKWFLEVWHEQYGLARLRRA